MRAHTITIRSAAKRRARRRVLALALGITALAIPATVSADPPGSDHSVYAFDGGSSQSSGSDYSSVTSITGGSSEPAPIVGSPYRGGRGFETVQAIGGPPSGEPTFASGSPAGDGFDWADAALGAGAALALAAFGGAALLTARRRTAMSPS
jgi:hypothetical protein